jgi:hypothetical protein
MMRISMVGSLLTLAFVPLSASAAGCDYFMHQVNALNAGHNALTQQIQNETNQMAWYQTDRTGDLEPKLNSQNKTVEVFQHNIDMMNGLKSLLDSLTPAWSEIMQREEFAKTIGDQLKEFFVQTPNAEFATALQAVVDHNKTSLSASDLVILEQLVQFITSMKDASATWASQIDALKSQQSPASLLSDFLDKLIHADAYLVLSISENTQELQKQTNLSNDLKSQIQNSQNQQDQMNAKIAKDRADLAYTDSQTPPAQAALESCDYRSNELGQSLQM